MCVCARTHAHIRTYTYDMTLSILSVGPEVVHLHSYVENRGVLLYSSLLYLLQSGSLGTDMHVAVLGFLHGLAEFDCRSSRLRSQHYFHRAVLVPAEQYTADSPERVPENMKSHLDCGCLGFLTGLLSGRNLEQVTFSRHLGFLRQRRCWLSGYTGSSQGYSKD